MQSFSTLSLLSTSTAIDACDHPFTDPKELDNVEDEMETAVEMSSPSLSVGMSFDDNEASAIPLPSPLKGSLFRFRNTDFIAKIITYPSFCRVEVRVCAELPMEIAYVAQVRIRTGTGEGQATKVVDKDVFHFGPFMHPLIVNVVDDRVLFVHFEMRFVNLVERPHPQYTEGDVTLHFPDGPPIVTWRSLLAHHSPYMRDMLRCVPEGGMVDVSPFPREDFITLLSFIYPTRMPIYKDFKGLVRAANAFRVETVLYACARHFVDHPDWSIEKKIPEAVKIELLPAIEELVYRAYQAGLWSMMISAGMQPENFCGPAVYRNIVCPAILKAKSMRYGQTLLIPPWRQPDYFNAPTVDQWMYVKILVMGTPFYMNRGVLTIYGAEGFVPSENPNELIAMVTHEFIDACKSAEATPGEVVMSLLTWLHPLAPPIPSRLLRASLHFAYHHKMHIVVEELEQLLIQEPPESSERLLENFILAERLELDNLLRTNLQRVDGSCQILAAELIHHPFFQKLSAHLRDRIVDRICSGWGIYNCTLVKKQGTKHCTRNVTLLDGGPPTEEGMAPETFHSMNSQSIFGPHHDMITLSQPYYPRPMRAERRFIEREEEQDEIPEPIPEIEC